MKGIVLASRVCLFACLGFLIQPGNALALNIDVICPASLQAAIDLAAPGDTIRIEGNCVEDVIITTDGLTLTHKNNPTEGVDGWVRIDGAQRVRIMNIEVVPLCWTVWQRS